MCLLVRVSRGSEGKAAVTRGQCVLLKLFSHPTLQIRHHTYTTVLSTVQVCSRGNVSLFITLMCISVIHNDVVPATTAVLWIICVQCQSLVDYVLLLLLLLIFYLFCCVLYSLLPWRSVGRLNFDKGLHILIMLIQK